MGSSCGITKKEEFDQIIVPVKIKRNLKFAPPPDEFSSKIGKFYVQDKQSKTISEWKKIILDQESYPSNKSKLNKKIRLLGSKGIPSEYRWRVWTNLILKEKIMTEQEYLNIEMIGDPYHTTIKRDLDRSFPAEPYFNKKMFGVIGQAALERILSKFATSFPEIGYCQGMNFIAGFLLLVSGGSEVEVFHFMKTLFTDFSLLGFFKEGLQMLKQYVWVSKKLIEKKFPKIHDHLIAESIPDDLWLLKWIMTIFTMVLPSEILVRIWDNFIIRGLNFLFTVILSIISIIQDDLLSKDSGEICVYLSEIRNKIKDVNELFDAMKNIKLKKDSINKLLASFKFDFSPCKSKQTTGEEIKLPPIKKSPVKYLSKSPDPALKASHVITLAVSPPSPKFAKQTKVPVLPHIRRHSLRRLSFGMNNKSCEVSMNGEFSV